ncbi:hypothetical protein HDV00_006836 [Rhizophlyctis rosea]|nr:hypothetical protein HDV00_006836 [Rhizophlyctis rosea]
MASSFVADFGAFGAAPQQQQQQQQTPTAPTIPDSFSFDESKLAAADSEEKKEMYVFQWLTTLEKDLKKAVKSALSRAAIHCVGVLSEAHGGKLLSLFPETASSFTKIINKAKEAEIPLRFETTVALTRALRGAGKGASEQMIKDFLKIGKAGLADKLPLIRSVSAELLESIYKNTAQPPPLKLDEYESLLLPVTKALESGNYPVRRTIASFIASILTLSQSAPPVPKVPPKKQVKGQPAPEAPAPGVIEQNILSPEEMLSILSYLCIKSTSKEVRVGIAEAYSATFKRLGIRFIESNYPAVVKNLMELVSHPRLTASPNDVLLMRDLVGFLLREVVGKMLTETGQGNALRELCSQWLKKWPAVLATDVAPSEPALICVLNEVAALLIDLGPAAISQQDAIVEPLTTLLNHPSRTVNIALSWSLRCLCTALPSNLPQFIEKILALLKKDSAHLSSEKSELLDRFVGHGTALAALLTVVPKHVLYITFDSMAKIFGLSTQLLKSAASGKDPLIMCAQAQVAWTLIGGLMCLGPKFVKVHLSQLLLMWKNVFPKHIPKESSLPKAEVDLSYVLVSRGAALAALQSFLVHNGKELATSDVAKRIVVLLNNTLSFASSLPGTYQWTSIERAHAAGGSVPITPQRLSDNENLLRKYLFACFTALPPTTYEISYGLLLRMTLDALAPDPEKSPSGPASVPDAKSGQVVLDASILTSLIKGMSVEVARGADVEDRGIGRSQVKDTDVRKIEVLLEQHAFYALEHDPHNIFVDPSAITTTTSPTLSGHNTELLYSRPRSPPPHVALVDAAIELFAILLPLQNAQVQESTMEQMIRIAKLLSNKVPAGRKRALEINSIVAVVGALKYVMARKGGVASGKVAVTIRDLVEDLLSGPDVILRTISSEALGRLSRTVSNQSFVNPLIQNLVDQVVKNRDPDARAGAALALGCIHSYVGGMAASAHLKTIVGILHSLAADPHPLVHTWALHSLWLTIESAGLMYQPYVNSSLSVIAKLFMSESHEPAAPLANAPGGDSNEDVYPAFGRILHALVGVVGPELQSSNRVRELCFGLYEELKNDDDPFAVVEAIRCIQHFILFAPKYVDIASLMPFLQLQLAGDYYTQVYQLRKAAVTCLYQLSRRDAGSVIESSVGNQVEEQLFGLLDTEVDGMVRDEIKDILGELLRYLAPRRPSRWVDLCRSILAKASAAGGGVGAGGGSGGAGSQGGPGGGEEKGEEDEDAFDVDHGEDEGGSPTGGTAATKPTDTTARTPNLNVVLLPRWRTQKFALTCLRRVLDAVRETKVGEHFDLGLARSSVERTGVRQDYLVLRLTDLVRMAFAASTAPVNDLRLEGLVLLQDVLEKFRDAADPDFEDHALLEQYQAQISAALTPAFATDADPQVMSAACRICAVYAGSGINKDLSTLSRVLRLLSGLLDVCSDPQAASKAASAHVALMLRLSILSAYAEMHIASLRHEYLEEVVAPNIPKLTTLWVGALQEYAKLRLDSDMFSSVDGEGKARSGIDTYLDATRDVVLPFYATTWSSMMECISSVGERRPDVLAKALRAGEDTPPPDDDTAEPRPPKLFFMLLGLCVETISGGNSTRSTNTALPTLTSLPLRNAADAKNARVCLESLGRLVGVSVVGRGLLDEAMFVEVMNVLDRVVQTDEVGVRVLVLRIVRQVVGEYGEGFFGRGEEGGLRSVPGSVGSVDVRGSADLMPMSPLASELPPTANTMSIKVYKVLKIVSDVFLSYVPGLSDNAASTITANANLKPESVALLSLALETLTALIALPSVNAKYGHQLLPISLFFFTALLEHPKFSTDVAPKVLLNIKRSVEGVDKMEWSEEQRDVVCSAVQGFVSDLVDMMEDEESAIDAAQGEGDSVVLRNLVLAAVLVVTTCPVSSHNVATQARLVQCVGRMMRRGDPQVALTATQTLRSFCVLATKTDDAAAAGIGASYVRLLVPHAMAVALGVAGEGRAVDGGKMPLVEETVKLLLLVYTLVGDERRKLNMLHIIIPLLLSFLSDSTLDSAATKQLQMFAGQTLISLATAQQQNFKIVIAGFDEGRRGKLEGGLKRAMSMAAGGAGGGGGGGGGDGRGGGGHAVFGGEEVRQAPKIELKTFANFG